MAATNGTLLRLQLSTMAHGTLERKNYALGRELRKKRRLQSTPLPLLQASLPYTTPNGMLNAPAVGAGISMLDQLRPGRLVAG